MFGTGIDSDAMRMFVAVATYGSFRQAALELEVSLATLSRKIARLENDLGVLLLLRTTRKVVVTIAGKCLLDEIEDPLQCLQYAIENLVQKQNAYAGLVRIATTSTIAEIFLMPILPVLRERWPRIRVHLLLDEEVIDLRVQRADLALRVGTLHDELLIARKLGTERSIRYTTPIMQEMEDSGVVTYGDDLRGIHPANVEAKDMHLVRQMVLANLGEAWLPERLCTQDEQQGRLIRVPDSAVFSHDLYVVYVSKRLPTRTRCVIDLLFEYAEPTS